MLFGLGVASRNTRGDVLEVFFPAPIVRPPAVVAEFISTAVANRTASVTAEVAAKLAELTAANPTLAAAHRALAEFDMPLEAVMLPMDDTIQTTAEAYLKLHLLSHRLALPNSLNLDGIFAKLPNVVWTDAGAIDVTEIGLRQIDARRRGVPLIVNGVDKFPRMTDYVVPSGVRIADASRIRLGAYLGEGTTVMHEGFINFNAGAMGPNMIEGRISQGVIVHPHSDLGGSSSTMGTLSGGGNISITIGRNCLIGANAGTGIPLGDRCTIEAGLYVTAGTRVDVLDENGELVKTVKARELAGQSDMLFLRNSTTARVECRTNRAAIELNEALHAHN
ncbi:MAG: 2,3,4,5-tetrahydropyridine-2,6-dicarboxylate N-succinyltransferase [Gammaproteobacteria bacterium]|nr:2,3,4,5-tetrahydropyridine-2,6-dicarboxylate N-succinyltransferase [Gammaproteobacteria bacterium]